jgi:hypothetical protein
MSGLSVRLQCLLLLVALVRRTSCATTAAPNAAAGGTAAATGTAPPPPSKVTQECRTSFVAMMNNDDWKFMNDTQTRWCRIIVENSMSVCCENAEFAKGKADNCKKDCIADCVHTKMIKLCNTYFGKACTLPRILFSKNNVSMKVHETFCIPKTCDNSNDMENNALVSWYDYAYRNRRLSTYWLLDYSDTKEMQCPSPAALIIIITLVVIIVIVCAIPISIFLFKAPKERGRVLQGADEDEPDFETTVEQMQAQQMMPQLAAGPMGMTGDTMGNTATKSGFATTQQSYNQTMQPIAN